MDKAEHARLNEEKWDKWASVADGRGWKYEYLRKAQDLVVESCAISAGMNFLDIGCGTGWAVGRAAKMAGGKGGFYGIDLSGKMILKAKENFKNYSNLYFLRANSESVPLESNFFDIIICTNSFHHYFDPGKVMKEMRRLLKRGGKLFILDPVADSLFVKLSDKIFRLLEPGHVRLYSSKEFKELMINAGLKYLGKRPVNKFHAIQTGEKPDR